MFILIETSFDLARVYHIFQFGSIVAHNIFLMILLIFFFLAYLEFLKYFSKTKKFS